MKRIYRKTIEITDSQVISDFGLVRVLAVEDRRGEPEVWYELEDDGPPMSITLRVFGTGFILPENPGTYIGHFLAHENWFVGHVYASEPYPEEG